MNRSMPPGIVIPEVPYPDVHQAADWLCQTFGFSKRLRIGNHRIQLTFGEGSLVVIQQSSPSSQSIMVRVSDIDQHYERAKQAGAQIINPPTDYPYGERQYTATDSGSHRWTFSQTIADVDPASWGGSLVE
jgi:uncharacterized glyoxalase superfamily protein PhnB